MARVSEYRIREYPEPQNLIDLILGNYKKVSKATMIKEELGQEGFSMYTSLKRVKEYIGTIQARIPFEYSIN